jgi:hypothetical protein
VATVAEAAHRGAMVPIANAMVLLYTRLACLPIVLTLLSLTAGFVPTTISR